MAPDASIEVRTATIHQEPYDPRGDPDFPASVEMTDDDFLELVLRDVDAAGGTLERHLVAADFAPEIHEFIRAAAEAGYVRLQGAEVILLASGRAWLRKRDRPISTGP